MKTKAQVVKEMDKKAEIMIDNAIKRAEANNAYVAKILNERVKKQKEESLFDAAIKYMNNQLEI